MYVGEVVEVVEVVSGHGLVVIVGVSVGVGSVAQAAAP